MQTMRWHMTWMLGALLVIACGSSMPGAQATTLAARTGTQTPSVRLTGKLLVVWEDPRPGSPRQPVPHYTLLDADGHTTALVVDAQSTPHGTDGVVLHNQQVIVAGTAMGPATVQVRAITAAQTQPSSFATASTAAPARVSGAQPFVTLLCRFSDQPTLTPHPPSWYATLMGAAAPGLDHYWREVSYNTINLQGSVVRGWYNLPHPRSYYVFPSGGASLTKLTEDCTAAADADVFFPQFAGVNMIFNNDLGGASYGGVEVLTRDGQSKQYGATWIEDSSTLNQGLVAHEMGHAFGLSHSSGPYDATYDSQWDVMSGQSTCTPFDPVYRCVAAHPLAYHKAQLGWIPAEDRYLVGTPGTHQITIGQLATPAPGSAYLLAQVPINGSATQLYTLEARRFTGYDRWVPGDGVVIHHVDTTRGDQQARVVDPDTNGNPNDAGAIWVPGETFRDMANGITVRVDQATTTGFVLTITTTMAACPDMAYEPDNGPEQVRAFTLGTTEPHAFCDIGDADWVFFHATAGTTYRIETRNLAPGTDTVLTVMGNSTSRTDDNSNGGKASVIEFTATHAGRYDVFTYQVDGNGSATYTYDLRITASPPPVELRPQVYIPMVRR